MRQGLLWLSERQGVFNFVRRNGLARQFASRFVAGETIEQGVEAARELSRRGITASLDLLGESVTAEAEAVAARDQYLRMLDRMAASGVEVNVSVKLTQMGLDISEELCVGQHDRASSSRRQPLDGFVRLDMEGSDYTQRTLDFFRRRLFDRFGAHCGVVIQSMLRRSEQDIEDLIAMQARVRLCKGAYLEPPTVAFPDKADVDRNYVRLMERLLLERGTIPGIATHDETIIAHARALRPARRASPPTGSSSRCCTACGAICRTRLRKAGLPAPGLYPLRNPVVSLSHAAAGGAARQHRLHPRQHRAGVGAGTVSELTLGGYMAKHDRAAAFGGSDGQAYSVAIYVDEEPDVRGLFGAALLFVRWSSGGDRPVGHRRDRHAGLGPTQEEAASPAQASRSTTSRPRWTRPSPARPSEW